MRGLIFTGGEGPPATKEVLELLKGNSITVAADSGLILAEKIGIKADFVIGDMDSLENAENILKNYPKEAVLRYEKDKDYTDTELAISLLAEKGCTYITIAGGYGGRVDHFIGLLYLFFREIHPDLWILKNEVIYCIDCTDKHLVLDTEKGEVISVFPLSPNCKVKSRGLKWQLDSLAWSLGDVGISNVAAESSVEIEVLSGRVLLVKNLNHKGV